MKKKKQRWTGYQTCRNPCSFAFFLVLTQVMPLEHPCYRSHGVLCGLVCFSSYEGFKHLHVFDDFVVNALSRRAPVKLDRLTFKRDGKCSAKLLQTVFDYTFLHGVRELEAHIVQTIRDHESWTWPIWSSDSLTSFKLRCNFVVGCPYLEPRSGSFKNLTTLHLQGVIIKDLDMFSGFPALDKLRLLHCFVKTNGKALHVHAQQLSEFTFFFRNQNVNCCEMMTPKLRYFEWGGNSLPRLKAHLPVLDTVVIANYNGHCLKEREKIMFDNLLMMFNTFYAAKSLTASASTIHLLTLFPCSPPLWDLKCLKLDFSPRHMYIQSRLFLSETLKLVPGVKAYMLHKSHDAKCTVINDPNTESPCSNSQKSTTQSHG